MALENLKENWTRFPNEILKNLEKLSGSEFLTILSTRLKSFFILLTYFLL